MSNQALIINGFEAGMADSPHLGIGLLRNADIESYPGAVKVAKKPVKLFHSLNTVTFTADAGTDICTASGSIATDGFFTGAAVYFTTTGTLPAGLSLNTVYYLYKVTNTTFQVCTSYKNSAGSSGGTVINITDAGTGTHTMNPVPVGTINWIINDDRGDVKWMLSSNGRVYFVLNGESFAYLFVNAAIDTGAAPVTNANGNGMVLTTFSSTTKTFLFVYRNAVIDVVDIFGQTAIETPGWSNAWQSLNTGSGVNNSHHAIVAQDDAIYFCDDRYVGSIIETVGSTFDPSNSATFTYNNQALDLPKYEIAQCLEELGVNLMIGGNTFNKIYPWDRISDSFIIPLACPESGIKRMKNLGGTIYILAGGQGNIYSSPGTYTKFVKKIPPAIVNNSYVISPSVITWGGLTSVNSTLIFGVGGQTAGSSGVYRLYPDGRLIHDNTPTAGSLNVVGIYAKNDFYWMGYLGGADQFTTTQYTTDNPTIFQSPLYKIGNKTSKAKYSVLEVQLGDIATSGQIIIGYRRNKKSSFTTLATFDADSVNSSFKQDIGITDLENIQIQAQMQGNLELLEIRLYP